MKAARPVPQRSLKAKALQCLAQREHSRAELRRKLLAHARTMARAAQASAGFPADEPSVDAMPDEPAAPDRNPLAEVEATLDWLEAHRYLSQERFVESRVHARAARFGNLRIQQELKQHAVVLSPEAAQALRASELDRAREVWSRRFPAAPAGPAERARQARFLAGRGFSPAVVRQLLRSDGAGSRDVDPADDDIVA